MTNRPRVENRVEAATDDTTESARSGGPTAAGTTATRSGMAVSRTRVSSAWAAVTVGLMFLIALLIFIFQNLQSARVTFLSLHARVPLGLSLLSSAVLGAVVVFLLAASRLVQLRRAARHHHDAAVAATKATTAG